MDVHPANQPIHTWKDFLVHLLTITIGLFIALTLEAAVESMHHRHLVCDARENLRREIEGNHKLYAENVRALQLNRDQLAHDIDQLRDLRESKKLEHPHLSWDWSWNSYGEAAWRTARDGGAVLYMDSASISDYAEIYGQQQYVNATGLAIINEETKAAAPLKVAKDPLMLTPDEIQTLLIKSAEIDLSFQTLQSTMKSLDGMYTKALTGP